MENSAPVIAAASTGVGYQADPFVGDIGPYFCVPENDRLVSFWDMAEDRLFKIRHCMNIDGVVRALPLFAPPINPAALTAAAEERAGRRAADGGTAQPPVPFYRFATLIQHAKELAATVAQLGRALLAALEKKDAEALGLLQVSQQQSILDIATSIKEQAIEQAAHTGEALAAALASAQSRKGYYDSLIATGLNPQEWANFVALTGAAAANIAAIATRHAAAVAYLVPQAGSPFAMTYGGQQTGSALFSESAVWDAVTTGGTIAAQLALTSAQYDRRAAEWALQSQLAGHDIQQIQAQIAANQTQRIIAERDLAIHLTSIAQNEAVRRFLTGKFARPGAVCVDEHPAVRSALPDLCAGAELARSAQRALQYELNSDTTFVNFGYWDGTRRGLLAGEGLLLALNQMEKAYVERNARALQIEKTISLAVLDPLALRDLIETGECVFSLSEKLLDDDYPGHYARKITTLSVSIPAITGPYQNLHATLTQLANQVVTAPDANAVNFLLGGENPGPFGSDVLRTDWWVNQQIALSNGLGDHGVFDTNPFDGRFLPFEGTGAVSTWRLSMPKQTNHFDFAAISDVIIALRYQAFDGGARFRDQMVQLPAMSTFNGSAQLPLAQLFSSQWYEFLHTPADPSGRQTLHFTLANLVPPHVSAPVLTGFSLHLQVPDNVTAAGRKPYLELKLGSGLYDPFNLNTRADYTQVVPRQTRHHDCGGMGHSRSSSRTLPTTC